MEKRLILAVGLSVAVLLVWSHFLPKPPAGMGPAKVTQQSASRTVVTAQPELPASSLWTYSGEKFEITFIKPQAAIKEVVFKDYQSQQFPLQYGLFLAEEGLDFKLAAVDSTGPVFISEDQAKQVIKRLIFSKSNYIIELEIQITNLSPQPLRWSAPLILGVLDFSRDSAQGRFQDVTVALKERTLHTASRNDMHWEEIRFLGLRDRYFCGILEPAGDNYQGFLKKVNSNSIEIGMVAPELLIASGKKITHKFFIYLGPQELETLTSGKPQWAGVMNYGTFNIISLLLLQTLAFFQRLVNNWGVAIILLSITIYLVLFPLTLKQMRSLKQMQAIQPQIEQLQKMYHDNPQRRNKGLMELYREHKINPLGGCLPMLLQLPIFFALYQALIRSIALKGASFLWIKDLAEPDRLRILPFSLPVLGNEINLLPILMALMMFWQQKISPASASTGSTEQQKLMLIILPLMFGLIFYHMPAGLVLYWSMNSGLMLAYQLRITKFK